MRVFTHKMAYKKVIVPCVWSHNLPILARMQLKPKKGTSLIVDHLFGVQIARIRRIVFELCMREKRKKKERKTNNIKIFTFDFLYRKKN